MVEGWLINCDNFNVNKFTALILQQGLTVKTQLGNTTLKKTSFGVVLPNPVGSVAQVEVAVHVNAALPDPLEIYQTRVAHCRQIHFSALLPDRLR